MPVNDSGLVARWSSWTPSLRSILRIVTAFLFMQVGTAKLFAFPAEHLGHTGVDEGGVSVRVENPDPFERGVHDRLDRGRARGAEGAKSTKLISSVIDELINLRLI